MIAPRTQREVGLRSEKIRPEHLERLAVVYVRQSTPQQVLENQESTRLQYNLRVRAGDLGWSEKRILVIDEDLGKSGATAEGRTGFKRMVSEVTLGHVGLILGLEMSRLARSCKDWHQLLEACGLFGTLIADLDGIYDPAHYNDRLLLGLKGTMSEAELHILKQRMYQGKLAKARRGELRIRVPAGYVRLPSGEVAFDPDEQAQAIVRLVFGTFEKLRTVNAVLRHLVHMGVRLGIRSHTRAAGGELEWRRPNATTLRKILQNPFYAGAYVYGRRQMDPRRRKPGHPATGRIERKRDEWHALIKDRFPAYITWEQYEWNLAQLQANRTTSTSLGVPREGAALLGGLVICGRCGHRMSVTYEARQGRHSYACLQEKRVYGGNPCQSVAGTCVDTHVRERVLAALEPASLELSLEAERHVERERAELQALWGQRAERARYEAERAARSYGLVEPENRLVARQLEQAWEEKLIEQRRVEEEISRLETSQPRVLTSLEREAIRQLAKDIPALWGAATTTNPERKEIVRQVVRRVVIDAEGSTERVRVGIEWIGGGLEPGIVIRPVNRFEKLSYFPRMCDLLKCMLAEGATPTQMADRLHAEGMRPPKRSERHTAETVARFLKRQGLATPRLRRRVGSSKELGADEWWVQDLARHLPMSEVTLYNWIRRGLVDARKGAWGRRRWIVRADEAEVARLRERHARPPGDHARRRWAALAGEQAGTAASVNEDIAAVD